MMTIYHNSRCRKSRETLQILVDNNLDFKVIEYLKVQLSKTQIETLINRINSLLPGFSHKDPVHDKVNGAARGLSRTNSIPIGVS